MTFVRSKAAYITIILAIVFAWFVLQSFDLPYMSLLESLRNEKFYGPFFYTLISFGAIVIAPLSTLALTPLAASIWGWKTIFIASIIGWHLGCMVNFWIAGKFREWVLKKKIGLEKLDQITDKLDSKKQFYMMFLLRMIIPADILSYALGLTKVKFKIYFWATLFGIMPFGFIFSYGGTLLKSWYLFPFTAGAILLYTISGRIVKKMTK